MGGATEHWGADGFEAAHSSYQGQSVTHRCAWSSIMCIVQSCRGTSLSEVRYTPEGIEVRFLVVIGRAIMFFRSDVSSQNDRRWCIITADTHAILTAREVASVCSVLFEISSCTQKCRQNRWFSFHHGLSTTRRHRTVEVSSFRSLPSLGARLSKSP